MATPPGDARRCRPRCPAAREDVLGARGADRAATAREAGRAAGYGLRERWEIRSWADESMIYDL